MSHCFLVRKIWHGEITVHGEQSIVFLGDGEAFTVWIDALGETVGQGLFWHSPAEGELDAEESQEVADGDGHGDCAGLAGELHQVKMRPLVAGGTQLVGWVQVGRNWLAGSRWDATAGRLHGASVYS